MYVFKVHAISRISRWPCGPNQCRCLNPLQANMLTLIFLPRHYNNGCMFSKSTEFLKSSILRAALEAKFSILISVLTVTTARDVCVRSPQNGLRIFDALVVLISASHSFIPASCCAGQMLTLICFSSSATMRYTLYIFTIRQRDW